MRRSLKWLTGAGSLAMVSACFGSNDSNPNPDASYVEPDAGSVPDAPEPAAPGPDASPDAYKAEAPEASIDAGYAGVTVVVQNAAGPEQGVAVVFQDAFNEVLGTIATDSLGRAAQLVPAGIQVTVVMGAAENPQLLTIESVQPGDVLAVYDPTGDPASPSVTVALGPDAGPPPGTSSMYGMIGGCSLSGVPGTTVLSYGDCQWHGGFPVVVVATAGADGGYGDLAYTYARGTLAADGGTTSVTMPGPWNPLGSQSIGAVNVPDAGPSGEWALSLDEVTGNVVTPTTYFFDPTMDPTTSSIESFPALADSSQAEVSLTVFNGNTNQNVTGMVTRPLADAGTTTFDVSQLLPLIDSVNLDTAAWVLSWGSSTGSLASADGVLAQISWTDTTDAGAPIQGAWTLVAPPGVHSATLPALPSTFAAFTPGPSAVLPAPTVAVVDADFIAGYDQLRSLVSTLPLTSALVTGRAGNQAPPLPVDGTLRLTATTQPGD